MFQTNNQREKNMNKDSLSSASSVGCKRVHSEMAIVAKTNTTSSSQSCSCPATVECCKRRKTSSGATIIVDVRLDVVSSLTEVGMTNLQRGELEKAELFFSHALHRFEGKKPATLPAHHQHDLDGSCSAVSSSHAPNTSLVSSNLEKGRGGEDENHEYDEGIHSDLDPIILKEDSDDDERKRSSSSSSSSMIASTLYYNIALTKLRRESFSAAKETFKLAMEKLVDDPIAMHKTLHNLGYCCYREGNHSEALRYFQSAIELGRTVGLQTSLMAGSLNSLGVLYFHHCSGSSIDLDKADDLFEESLSIYKSYAITSSSSSLSPSKLFHKEIATVTNNVGRMHYLRGEYEEAKDCYEEALRLRKAVLGSLSMDYAAICYNVGQAYHQLNDLRKAMEYYNQFLSTVETLIGPNTREAAIVKKCIAEIYRDQSELEEARRAYETSLRSARIAMGVDHPEVASILNKVGNLCYEMREFNDALAFYMEGLDIERKHMAPNSPHVIITVTNIAHVHKHMWNYEKALSVYSYACRLQVESFGASSIEVATTLSNIGLMQYHLKSYQKAFEAYQEALRIRRDIFGGDDHPDVASNLNSLGLVLFKQDLLDMAKDCFFAALGVRRKVLGPDHHDVAILWYNLATIYFETGDDQKAIQFYKESLRVERVSLGPDHLDVAVTLQHLGQVLQQLGLFDEAIHHFEEALMTLRECSQQQGEKHYAKETRILNQLGNLYLQKGQVSSMMNAFSEASRLLKVHEQSTDSLVITGYNYYGLSRAHPPNAPSA